MKKNKYKNEKGVTIVALTVTIIVLMILAGISLAIVNGDNKLVWKSEQAKSETEIMQYQEKLEILKQLEFTNNYIVDEKQFIDNYIEVVKADEMFKQSEEVTPDYNNQLVIVVTSEGYRFNITMDDVIYIDTKN